MDVQSGDDDRAGGEVSIRNDRSGALSTITTAEALACDLAPDGVALRAADTEQLFARARERLATADGATLVFPGDDEMARALFEFVLAERRCCARIAYELAFEPNRGEVRLTLRGSGAQIDGIRAWTKTTHR
jgi:hypothetical protein